METDNTAIIEELILSLSNQEDEALLEIIIDEIAKLGDNVKGGDISKPEGPIINYSIEESIFSPETVNSIDYLELFYGPAEEASYVLASNGEEEVSVSHEQADMKEAEIILDDIQLAAVTYSTYSVSSEKMRKIDMMIKLDYGRFAVLSLNSLTNDVDYTPL